MNTSRKVLYLKIAAAITVVSTLVYAAMTFAPSTQPATTSAPYAFNAGNLLDGTARAYRPWFENGAWQGDLIEYNVDEFGVRTTNASVGSNPPVAGGSNWMARATYLDKETNVTEYWKESLLAADNRRNIFTVNGDSGDQVDFLWDNLSASQQSALDQGTVDLALTGSYDSPMLNFIRGDHSNERGLGGTYRSRYSLLGDIIGSNPVYIGAPEEAFVIEGFPTFKSDNISREPRVAVGANDGMLHVFDASDGVEVYAYIPSMLMGKLDRLSAIPYDHTYYVDGELFYGSAIIDAAWYSLLSGGLGAGGKGLFILDVTNPDVTDDKVLYEITGDDIGYIYGKPRYGRNSDGTWNVYIGNGYGSTNGVAKLAIISLENGSVSYMSTGIAGGLSAPALVSGPDRVVDYVFAGDSNGDMWKFDIANNTVTKIFDGIADQPIMSAPVVGAHPNGGYMVYFGTGNTTSLVDAADPSYPTQAIYGIWDSAVGTTIVQQYVDTTEATFSTDDGNGNVTSNTLDVRYIVESVGGDPGNASATYYSTACINDSNCAKGWMVELPNTGERIVGTPNLRAGRVSIVTTNPLGGTANDINPDLVGDSWLMSLDYLTGGDGSDVSFNLSGDSILNADDRFTVDGISGVPPVGIGLGDGLISQPEIVRIADGIDMVFINGFRVPLRQIPPREGPFLTGHIDVHTDSPSGGDISPNSRNKHSELYNIDTGDGFGRNVDGHFHEYDTVNNIHHVDLFELEPRRGLPSAAPIITGDSPCDTTTDNQKEVEVGGLCLQAVEGELNRAYDTLQTDADGNDEGSLASEVYAIGTSNALSNSDKFILVVANGDLTPAATLQIGCRTWDIVEYENMITSQLEGGVDPIDLEDTVNGYTGDGTGTLVFTLDEIQSGAADSEDCPDESPNPTIRLLFSTRSILDGAIHGTRAQCVLGLHDYRDPVDYWDDEVLCHAPAHLYGETVSCGDLSDPGAAYIEDPADNVHITEIPSNEGTGFRWRNGALTVQLLKVNNATNAAEYALQNPDDLPVRQNNRFGGTYAQAFTAERVKGEAVLTDTEGANESGLMYESSMYWHLGDLADGIQRGAPASVPCYGDPSWSSVFTQETRGLTYGQYQALYDDILDEVLQDYDAAVTALEAALESGDEDAIQSALLTLAELLQDPEWGDELSWYNRYRDYAPGNIPEQHLRDIDQDRVPPPDDDDDDDDSGDDGTPNLVEDLEGFGMGGGGGGVSGNDVIEGLRIWIDPRD